MSTVFAGWFTFLSPFTPSPLPHPRQTFPDHQGRGREGLVQGGGTQAGTSHPWAGYHLHVLRANPDGRCWVRRGAPVKEDAFRFCPRGIGREAKRDSVRT